MADWCSTSTSDRAGHTYGKSYRDLVRATCTVTFRTRPTSSPSPAPKRDVVAVLDWCAAEELAAIPYGGWIVGRRWRRVRASARRSPAWCRSTSARSSSVVEVDRVLTSGPDPGRCARPALEDQLRPHGFTLRHFPQSFELVDARRLAGDPLGRPLRHACTRTSTTSWSRCASSRPSGISESRRLPGSGAGPSPDRLFLGLRGQPRASSPRRGCGSRTGRVGGRRPGSCSSRFADGVAATRAIAQSGLFPTNCRLLDGAEAANRGRRDRARLDCSCSASNRPTTPSSRRWPAPLSCAVIMAVTCLAGVTSSDASDRRLVAAGDDAVGSWRSAFLRAPYQRNAFARCGVIAETFETACTWDGFDALHAGVTATVEEAIGRICGGGWVTCRFTHVYPDGPAPYFTVTAPGRIGSELAMWDEIKAAASDALLAHGGTITHHHAVGRDHDPWYRRQRPESFGRALAAAKSALDPAGILNPGVIV